MCCKCNVDGKGERHVHSEEDKQRISNSLKGHIVSDEARKKIGETSLRHIPWNKGLTDIYSKEVLEKMREGGKNTPRSPEIQIKVNAGIRRNFELGLRKRYVRGIDHALWRGSYPFSWWALNEWRVEVLKRDNYTCQVCGQYGGKLEADHIVSKWEDISLIFHIGNGRTLCRECHKETDNWAGKAVRRPKEYQLPLITR